MTQILETSHGPYCTGIHNC